MTRSPVVVLPLTDAADRTVAALRSSGVGAETASVEAAMSRLAADPPSCVVCHDDGERSAMELLAGVRERRPTLPAVVVGDGGALAGDATRVLDPGDDVGPVVDAVRSAVTDGGAASADRDPATLAAERDRFDTLVEQLPDPTLITSLDPEPVVRRVNEAFEEQFGFDGETLRGERVAERLVPSDDELVDLRSLDDGEVVERTVTRTTADGPREFLLRGTRATIDGRVEGFVVYSDVTERRERARRLDALHGVTRRLLAAENASEVADVAVGAAQDVLELPAAGVHLRPEGGEEVLVPVAFSEQTAALFDGPPPTYGPGDAAWAVFESGDLRVVEDVAEADDVTDESPVRSAVLLPLGEHGVLVSSSPAPREFSAATVDLARLFAANVEAALDDAAHREALRDRERELRAERDRLSALFENVPIPALRVDHRDGEPVVRSVNPAFEETFGYDAETIHGENVDDFIVPDDPTVEPSVKDEAASGEVITREVRRETARGLRDFLLTTAPVDPGTADAQAYGFYIDITERNQRQQRLRVLSRVLRHDIRNRMNVIDGNAELVRERVEDPRLAAPAERIQEAADELLSLSYRTRRVERTVADAADEGTAGVAAAVTAVVEAFRDRYPGASFDLSVSDDATVEGSGAFHVALTELLENAVEHNDRASPSVGVAVEASDGAVVVRVTDDGPGVPEHEQALIRGDREPTQTEHTSGIGLWMVKWIATALGGDVSIADRDPRGAEVTLWLPRADEA